MFFIFFFFFQWSFPYYLIHWCWIVDWICVYIDGPGEKESIRGEEDSGPSTQGWKFINPPSTKQNQKRKNQGDREHLLKNIVSQLVASDPTSP